MRRLLCTVLLTTAAMAQTLRLRHPGPGEGPPPTPPGTGSLEGTVADSVSHAPLKKAQVTLSGNIVPPLTAVTDSSGRFIFKALPAGQFWMNASKPGYTPPQSIFGDGGNSAATLADGEQKKGIEIPLQPGSAITGRIVNEEGVPVQHCGVNAVQNSTGQLRHFLMPIGWSQTNEKGEYRIDNLAPGRYYVMAHCQIELPAPHPLLPRRDPRIPHQTYMPQFYGGGLDPATATRLALAAGATLENIDFQLTRVPASTLRGTVVGGMLENPTGAVNLSLRPANPLLRSLLSQGAGIDPHDHKFQIQPVIPGSYVLDLFIFHEGRLAAAARRNVEIGATPPEPLEISLQEPAELKGDVQTDSDDQPTPENGQISLISLEDGFGPPQPQGRIEKDGSFTVTGILPGRWRLSASLPGFIKSATLAGQPISPESFQIAAGATGPLHILIGTKFADVQVEVTGASAGRQVSVLIFPEDTERLGAGLERLGTAAGATQVLLPGMPPGRYRLLATAASNPWPILQRPDWLKALESHSAAVEVPEGGHVTATVEIIPREELMRVLEENQ